MADLYISDPARVAAVHATGLLDTAAEESFDRLTRLASKLLDAPVVVMNLIDADRQFSKSVVAPAAWPESRNTTLADSFCKYAVASRAPVTIDDTRLDVRVAASAVVTEHAAMSYLGTPLIDGEGHALGALCALDLESRHWTADQLALLSEVARSVVTEIELRTDIARRRELEHALQAAYDWMETRVNERTAELEEARAASERREAYFRALVENTRDVVAVFECDGTLRYANPPMSREYDHLPRELRGASIFALVHPDDVPSVRAAWDGALAIARPSLVTCRLHVRGGAWQLHEIVLENLCEDAAVVGLVAHIQNIAERQRVEEELRLGKEQLRQAEKIDAVGRLAGGIAHDFNNLLTVINGYSAMTLESMSEEDVLRADIGEILAAGRQAADLTRQLMAFSRRQLLEIRPVDINEVVSEAQRMLGRLIGEDIRIVTDLDADLWLVAADAGQMNQVLMNLVLNARDAMPAGGTISLSTQKVELSEAYALQHADVKAGPHVLLAIGDTGVGMDTETQFRIFEPFFTTKGVGKGTGLGLATVYGIVKQMGGHIWLYSEPGAGATFKIYLPRLTGPVRATPTMATAVIKAGGGETILLVEDDERVRVLVSRILRAQGYSVLAVSNGMEAMALPESLIDSVHLLLTDIVMPEMSGHELALQLLARRPDLPVVMISGYTADEIDRRGLSNDRMRLVDKPFTSDTLTTALRRALDDASAEAADAAADAAGDRAARQARIAVVDDNKDNRDVLCEMLEPQYEVLVFSSGSAALEAFSQDLPDLVITDIAMPGLSGIDVLARMRDDPQLRNLPVIAITARAMHGDRERLLAAGFDDYISKPIVEEQVLLDAVERQLATQRANGAP